jgi:uncharacterized membrane-anchored protein YhcB (DUF1043 family)
LEEDVSDVAEVEPRDRGKLLSSAEIRTLVDELEKCLSKSNPPPPKNGLGGWRAAGLVLSVLTAVTVPVLSVTWYASTKMNQLEELQRELDNTRGDLGGFREEVGSDIAELRKDVQRLREAFAAYTQTVLPMLTQDTTYRLTPPQTPHQPVLPPVP